MMFKVKPSLFIFEGALITVLLLPFISLISYLLFGYFFNYNNLYFIINIFIICLSFYFCKRFSYKFVKFFILFLFILVLNLIATVYTNGSEGIKEFLRTISGYYIFIFYGWCCFNLYLKNNNQKRLYRIIVYMACWISIINILLFIGLQTDDYKIENWSIEFDHFEPVADYVRLLNKNFIDYIVISANYDDVGFTRGIGYFYDTHSQYYLPLGAILILLISPKLTKNRKIALFLCVSAVLCSGIKTAYLTAVLLLLYYLWRNKSLIRFIKKVLPVCLLFFLIFSKYIITIFMGEGMWKILFQLFDHTLFIPILYAATYPINFVFGGAPALRDNPIFYSEVFWVTVTYYVGVIGLLIYCLPFRILKKPFIYSKAYTIPIYIFLIFVFSLTHYSVYMVGINNILSAIPIMAYIGSISNKA